MEMLLFQFLGQLLYYMRTLSSFQPSSPCFLGKCYEAIADARAAIELQPNYTKAIERGKV